MDDRTFSDPSTGAKEPQGAATRVTWQENEQTENLVWGSRIFPVPQAIVVVQEGLRADEALKLMQSGKSLLWRGDYHQAHQLLQAVARRLQSRRRTKAGERSLLEIFHAGRLQQAQQAALLARLLIPVCADYSIPLRRAPDIAPAALAAWGEASEDMVLPLREVLGVMGAWQWRLKGVKVAALGGATIHPHYWVFAPVRQEYLDLIAQAPLPPGGQVALDLGTGSGVIAAVLARRGWPQVVAVDLSSQAVACARENLQRLGLGERVEVLQADLYPADRVYDLVVCNPPWLPGKASSALDAAIYDPDSRMLRGFLNGLKGHLAQAGEAWLIMSDLAERIGLRQPDQLQSWIAEAGLQVLERLDTRPVHPRSRDGEDPLHAARAGETTSLWRLAFA